MNFDLRSERLNRGLSLRALADEIGVTVHTLWRAEAGSTPAPRNAKLIADFYGLKVMEIWPADESDSAAAAVS